MDPPVEDRGGEHRVGATVAHRRDEVLRPGRSTRCDDGHRDAVRDGPKQVGVEPEAGPIPVNGGDEQFSRPQLYRARRPLDGIERRCLAAALDVHGPRVAVSQRVDRDDDRLAAEAPGTVADQVRNSHGRGIERNLVGACAEHVAHLIRGTHTATNRQRDERPAGRPLDHIEQRAAPFGRGGDVEEHQLVGTLARVALG
jgi:hypothetical protein